jgi:hypothetical protein
MKQTNSSQTSTETTITMFHPQNLGVSVGVVCSLVVFFLLSLQLAISPFITVEKDRIAYEQSQAVYLAQDQQNTLTVSYDENNQNDPVVLGASTEKSKPSFFASFKASITKLFSWLPFVKVQEPEQVPEVFVGETQQVDTPTTKKVLILEFNPIIENRNNQRLNKVYGWSDPVTLENGYINDIKSVSGNYLQYQIVNRQVLDAFPTKKDGYTYTDQTYLACFDCHKACLDCYHNKTCTYDQYASCLNTCTTSGKCHAPDEVNYNKILSDYQVCEKRNSGEIDEVWLWGAPYFGYWEANMAGPGAFNTNGPVVSGTTCSKKLNIMGFNYERGVSEMIEDMGHRFEGTMRQAWGGWNMMNGSSPWDKFTYNIGNSGSKTFYGCGNVHFPHNGTSDYNWNNNSIVANNCNDWFNYPNMTEKLNHLVVVYGDVMDMGIKSGNSIIFLNILAQAVESGIIGGNILQIGTMQTIRTAKHMVSSTQEMSRLSVGFGRITQSKRVTR